MTPNEHRRWHIEHAAYLDRLVADFRYHTKPGVVVNLLTFLGWSFAQTITPTETREEVPDG